MTKDEYPAARRAALTETIHGVAVPDPYRWLEEDGSDETRAWVEAQNALTRSQLDGAARDVLVQQLRALYDYPRTLSLVGRGGRYFFTHNPGPLDQPILYVQDGLDGEPSVLLDPNALSPDGTTALTAYSVSPDGRHVAYALSEHGSDRQRIRVQGVQGVHGVQGVRVQGVQGVHVHDILDFVKFASIAWTRDGSGFYYLRFPAPGSVAPEDEQYFGRIYFHRLGDPQAADALVFAHAEREVVPLVHVSASGRWVVITAQRGASDDSEVYLREVETRTSDAAATIPLFAGFDAAYEFVEEANGRLLFQTTKDAAMGRIISIDPERPEEGAREVVAEGADRLAFVVMTRDRLVAGYLHKASHQIRVFALDGSPQGEISMPGIGSIVTLDAEPDQDEVRFVHTSFTHPPSAYTFRLKAETTGEENTFRLKAETTGEESTFRLNAETTGEESTFRLKAETTGEENTFRLKAETTEEGRRFRLGAETTEEERPFPLTELCSFRLQAEASDRYQTTQVWYPSKDGTQVSMFLVHRADTRPDGARPVLLSGYGGFNISRTPAYDPGNFPFLDAGGVFALANLRGGGEYGESWHRAGMLANKQNVFDDFIAAAEYLVGAGWTTPARIAIEGGSNGGLLVGAVMLQRPDLFGAVVCRVPVADMLRYHLFTVGRFWIPEYGSADDPEQFAFLLKYSPYHNVRGGVRYPPALVMTADTDDRVAPGMAKKFAARLQSEGAGGPFLIRVETNAGHGAGKPVAKVIDEDADILTFVFGALSR